MVCNTRHGKIIPVKIRTKVSGDKGVANTVKRRSKEVALLLNSVLKGRDPHANWRTSWTALLRIIRDRYLVVVVDVHVIKEFFRDIAEKTMLEETFQTCFVLFHKPIAVHIQTIKDNLQDLNSLQVVELLNADFFVHVNI